MKFLIIAALVAVASADYHDDVFHFSTLNGGTSLSGLKKTSFVQASQAPVLTKKVTSYSQPAITKYTSGPLIVSQPAYNQQVSTIKQYSQPASANQYTVKQIAQPAIEQYTVKQVSQPIYNEQYTVKQVAQPAIQQYTVKQVSQPIYNEQYTVKQIAQPAIEQYTVKQVSQPIYNEQYTVKQVAQPAVSQYSAVSGASTYASAYQGPQWRILSQIQEADPAGPYKLSFSTENGIQVQEEGTLIPSEGGAVIAAQGSYSYTAPDGTPISVSYVADENGFRAVGDHLPTPPPIPAEILKSLEENAASGEQYDDEGRLLKK